MACHELYGVNMPIEFRDIINRRFGLSGSLPYTQDEYPSSFPLDVWNYQSQLYMKYWDHFTGQIWQETIPDRTNDDGTPVLRWPLQINYIKTACIKQASVLFGEISDSTAPLAPIKCTARRRIGKRQVIEEEKYQAQDLEDFVNLIWEENSGRTLQQEGGLISQFTGGIVYQVTYEPENDDLTYPIGLNYLLPDFFLPVANSSKFEDLLEAWVVWRIPAREASIRFGFDLADGVTNPLYIEHWTEDEVTITIDNKPIVTEASDGTQITWDKMENPYGFVPFVYIPRKRAGSYYGMSLVDDLEGIVKELNSRIADLGEIIQETAQHKLYGRNLGSSIRKRSLANEEEVIDLGTTIPGAHDAPEVFAVNPPQIPAEMAKFPEYLQNQLGHDAAMPPIAFGDDQGSQRSGMTLFVRFWPLVSEAKSQRNHWGVGLVKIAQMIIKMAVAMGVEDININWMKYKKWDVNWSPFLPRDRDQLLNEVIMTLKEHILGPVDAMKKLDMVADPDDAVERGMAFYEWLVEQEAKLTAQPGDQKTQGVKEKVAEPSVQTGDQT